MTDPDRRPRPDGFDHDAIFADIVTHWSDDAAASDDAVDDAAASDETASDETADQPRAAPTPQVWRGSEVDDEYEEHFEPPPVAPLPVGDLQFWAIIVGMGGGPLLLLYLVLFNREASGYWMLTSIAMSVGGFALLVLRLPGNHDEDDNGARL